MTILAIVGLTAAIIIVSADDETNSEEEVAALMEEIAHLRTQLDALDVKLATLKELNAQLQDSLDTRDAKIDSLSELVRILQTTIRFGARPCLGTQEKKPKVLLRIVVNKGYGIEPRWLPEDKDKVAKIPSLREAVSIGQLEPDAFKQYASAIYHHGDTEDTFGGSCRFFVELEKDTASYRRFAQAVGVVNRYFLIANPSEVNRILEEGE